VRISARICRIQSGTCREPAIHVSGTISLSAASSGRQHGDISLWPWISTGPSTAFAKPMRAHESSTRSCGRFMDGGSRRSTSSSSLRSACSRGCASRERSIPAFHIFSSVPTAARTMPGSALIGSSSPSCIAASESRTAIFRSSGSIGRSSPPASRAASWPMVRICTPLSPARAACTRAMWPARRVWTTMVRRSGMKCGLHILRKRQAVPRSRHFTNAVVLAPDSGLFNARLHKARFCGPYLRQPLLWVEPRSLMQGSLSYRVTLLSELAIRAGTLSAPTSVP